MKSQILKISRAEYDSINAANYSSLKHLLTSGKCYKYYREKHQKSTPSLNLGLAFHTLCETNRFDSIAIAPTTDRRTKQGKIDWEAFTTSSFGKVILNQQEGEIVENMFRNLNEKMIWRMLRDGGTFEVSMIGQYLIGFDEGLLLKGCADIYKARSNTITDIKTISKPASEFSYHIYRYHYDLQAALYCELVKIIVGEMPRFVWAVCETVPPNDCIFVEASEDHLRNGKQKLNYCVRKLIDCVATGEYPGYDDEIINSTELHRITGGYLGHDEDAGW